MSSDKISRSIYFEGIDEASYGVLPDPIPTRKKIRATSDTLARQPAYTRSERVGTPRRRQASVLLDDPVSGQLVDEFSPIDHDDYLLATLAAAAWSSKVVVDGSGAGLSADFAAPASGSQTITAGAGTPFSGLTAGAWCRITGAASGGNNPVAKIESIGGGGASVVIKNADGVLEAGATIKLEQLSQIVDGTTVHSLGLLREYTHLTDEFVLFTGCVFTGMRVSFQRGQRIVATYEMQGQDEDSLDAAPTTTTVEDAPDSAAFTPNDILVVDIDGNAFCLSSFELAITNNVRDKTCLGTAGAKAKLFGYADVSGSFNYVYDDASKAFYERFVEDEPSAIAFVIKSADGGYVIEIDRIRQTSGNRAGGTGDSDIAVQANFEAEDGGNYIIRVARFAGDIAA